MGQFRVVQYAVNPFGACPVQIDGHHRCRMSAGAETVLDPGLLVLEIDIGRRNRKTARFVIGRNDHERPGMPPGRNHASPSGRLRHRYREPANQSGILRPSEQSPDRARRLLATESPAPCGSPAPDNRPAPPTFSAGDRRQRIPSQVPGSRYRAARDRSAPENRDPEGARCSVNRLPVPFSRTIEEAGG